MCADGTEHDHFTEADKMNGLSREDMEHNRNGHSTDSKAESAGQFAGRVVKSPGQIESEKVDAVRAAGYTDAQMVDMVAETAFGIITSLVTNTSAADLGASFPPDGTAPHPRVMATTDAVRTVDYLSRDWI